MKKFFEIVIYIIGLNLIALGISLSVDSGLGGSFWDSLIFSLEHITSISAGMWLFLTGIILTVIIQILDYKNYNKKSPIKMLLTICSGLFVGVFIDFWHEITTLMFSNLNYFNYIFGLCGIVLTGLGIATYSQTTFAIDPIDNFMMGLVRTKKISILKARYITDFIALAITLIIGFFVISIQEIIANGYLGMGSLIVFIGLSPCVSFFRKKLIFLNTYFK